MLAIEKAFVVGVLISIPLFLSECQIVDRKSTAVHFELLTVREALANCSHKINSLDEKFDCVEEYVVRQGVPREHASTFYHYHYGEIFVMQLSDRCLPDNPLLPYSKGPNKIDECGEGDDIE